MSEQQPTHRIVLGTEASKLIQGVEGNRQIALDKAILELKERAERADQMTMVGDAPSPDLSGLEDRLAAIEAKLDASTEAMDRLRFVALAEMRMTRLYIGAMMETRDEDDIQEILQLGQQTTQRLYDELDILTRKDTAELTREEERVVHMMREEMQRGVPEEKQHETGDRERA